MRYASTLWSKIAAMRTEGLTLCQYRYSSSFASSNEANLRTVLSIGLCSLYRAKGPAPVSLLRRGSRFTPAPQTSYRKPQTGGQFPHSPSAVPTDGPGRTAHPRQQSPPPSPRNKPPPFPLFPFRTFRPAPFTLSSPSAPAQPHNKFTFNRLQPKINFAKVA